MRAGFLRREYSARQAERRGRPGKLFTEELMKRHAGDRHAARCPHWHGARSQFEERLREHNRQAVDEDKAAAQIKPVKKMTEAEYDAWYVGRILA